MSQNSTAVNITDTASQILIANGDIKTLTITNNGSSTVYLGTDANVTDSIGFPITIGEVLKGNDYIGDWYAICSSGESSNLRIDIEVV